MSEIRAIPVEPNPPFYGNKAVVQANGTLRLWSTKYRHAQLRNWPAKVPDSYVCCVRWGELTHEKRKQLFGDFDAGQWVWIIATTEGSSES